MLACGTRIGIPRWLPGGGVAGAVSGAGAGGAGGENSAGVGEGPGGSAGIVIGMVSHGAIGHSASPFRAPGPGPADPAGPVGPVSPAGTAGGGSRCRPVSDRGPLSSGRPAQGASRLASSCRTTTPNGISTTAAVPPYTDRRRET